MRKSFKIIGIATSFALVLTPVMASTRVHSHPKHHMVIQAKNRDNAAFEAYYNQSRVEQPSCGSNCQPALMYGISY
jgi:hypothetical protein